MGSELVLCNVPARETVVQGVARRGVVQRCGPGPSISEAIASFTFYATFDVSSLCSYIPAGMPLLLPASSWARVGLKRPSIPVQVTDLAADSGGFVASRVWGEYRYSLGQYVAWLRSWSPRWSATMDYCCEPELGQVTRERQEKTTANVREAWERYRGETWAWVPTIQGVLPQEYKRHASELKELIEEMRRYYVDNSAWRVGIGTLCRRNDVAAVQAVLDAVREVLPDVPLHLWGVKLDALRSIHLEQVVSTDSAVWHQSMYGKDAVKSEAAARGVSMRRYQVEVNLPAYAEKVRLAVGESRKVHGAQANAGLIVQARAVLRAQGWTINIRRRRNRQYVYGARRNGGKVEQVSICPVSELEAWLARLGSLHNSGELP